MKKAKLLVALGEANGMARHCRRVAMHHLNARKRAEADHARFVATAEASIKVLTAAHAESLETIKRLEGQVTSLENQRDDWRGENEVLRKKIEEQRESLVADAEKIAANAARGITAERDEARAQVAELRKSLEILKKSVGAWRLVLRCGACEAVLGMVEPAERVYGTAPIVFCDANCERAGVRDAVPSVTPPDKARGSLAAEIAQRAREQRRKKGRCRVCNDSGHTCSACGAPGDGCPACSNHVPAKKKDTELLTPLQRRQIMPSEAELKERSPKCNVEACREPKVAGDVLCASHKALRDARTEAARELAVAGGFSQQAGARCSHVVLPENIQCKLDLGHGGAHMILPLAPGAPQPESPKCRHGNLTTPKPVAGRDGWVVDVAEDCGPCAEQGHFPVARKLAPGAS